MINLEEDWPEIVRRAQIQHDWSIQQPNTRVLKPAGLMHAMVIAQAAECAFCHLTNREWVERDPAPDGGFDYVTKAGWKVDVKGVADGYQVLFLMSNNPKADLFPLFAIDLVRHQARYAGYATAHALLRTPLTRLHDRAKPTHVLTEQDLRLEHESLI